MPSWSSFNRSPPSRSSSCRQKQRLNALPGCLSAI